MIQFLDDNSYWVNPEYVENKTFTCGYCNTKVASDKGYRIDRRGHGQAGGVYICPNCGGATFFAPDGRQFPGEPVGHQVAHLPQKLDALYGEARTCIKQQCYTAAVVLCREILRELAVSRGADKDLIFLDYVIYLEQNNYIPPNGKHWVDYIGQQTSKDGDAIRVMEKDEANDLLLFTEMLLRFNYEFPRWVERARPE